MKPGGSPPKRSIGILGGMGPIAGAYVHRRLMEVAATKFGCVQDADFPSVLYRSLPLDDGWSERGFDPDSANRIRDTVLGGVLTLAKDDGCGVVLVACNTVHAFAGEIRAALESLPAIFVDLLSETVDVAAKFERLALLATEATCRAGLYDSLPLIAIAPRDQQRVTSAIRAVMSGRYEEAARGLRPVLRYAERMEAGALVIGCTELPLAMSPTALPVVDSVECAVWAALRASAGM